MAIFIFGTLKFYTDQSVKDIFKDEMTSNIIDEPLYSTVFFKTLDDLTPTLNYDLPGTLSDKRFFLINDFPLWSWTHTLIVIVLIVISGFIMNLFGVTRYWQIGIFIMLIILGYLMGSIILNWGYSLSAEHMGLTEIETDQFRYKYDNNFDNVALPLIMAGLIGVLSIVNVLITRVKKAKSK